MKLTYEIGRKEPATLEETQTRLSYGECELKHSSLVDKPYSHRIKTQPWKWSGDNVCKEKDGSSAKKLEKSQVWDKYKSDEAYFTEVWTSNDDLTPCRDIKNTLRVGGGKGNFQESMHVEGNGARRRDYSNLRNLGREHVFFPKLADFDGLAAWWVLAHSSCCISVNSP